MARSRPDKPLVKAARARIVVMAGGGIDDNKAVNIIEHTGVGEIHVGLRSPVESPMLHRNLLISMGTAFGREYQRFVADFREGSQPAVPSLGRAVQFCGVVPCVPEFRLL
jgi:copper homeostasis protein CutC